MANTDAGTLPHSALNGFLFADVGIEASGMQLSVLSTLARVGVDPWQEAGRLAGLPRKAAIDALARIIATMPASLWPLPAATEIAARLVALLPTGGERAVAAPAPAGRQMSPVERVTALLPGFGGRPAARGQANAGANRRWTIVLLVVAAVLGGIVFNYLGGAGGRDAGPSLTTMQPLTTTQPLAGTPAPVPLRSVTE
ncbi:MAG: hypothetical protein P4L71_11090 [Acetobacteraceae bacterium]|nr:hypothetical protein [Acetobacteraceae bacterium]